jgi:hypothetical protein
MKLRAFHSISLAVAVLAIAAAPASASFGFRPDLDVTFTNGSGETVAQAGSHPFAMTTTLNFNTLPNPNQNPVLTEITDGAARDLRIDLPPGQAAAIDAVPSCDPAVFLEMASNKNTCPDDTVLGFSTVEAVNPGQIFDVPVYSLPAAPGKILKLGLSVSNVPVTLDVGLSEAAPYHGVISVHNLAQTVYVYKTKTVVWGDPTDPAHDAERGTCLESKEADSCPVEPAEKAFLTLPRACTGPLATVFSAESWTGDLTGPQTVLSHDDSDPPVPQGMSGCDQLGLDASTTAQPTTEAGASPTGFDFSLDVDDPGLTDPEGIAGSDIRAAKVLMPEGMTANPSVAEGLDGCSEAQLAAETASSPPGAGCPNASKIGSVEVETPLLDKTLDGSLFLATPYDNDAGSLIAVYMVVQDPELGISVKQALRVDPDPVTGRITTVAEDLPQFPLSHVRIHFREGARSPLATPPSCGEQDVEAILTPGAGGADVVTHSAFSISSGPEGGPCIGSPQGLNPAFLAGTTDNTAAAFSPFLTSLSRNDAEQELANFSFKLPPGLVGKLAGIPYCPEAAIAAARARSGPHGGAEELAAPSCPAASRIGSTLVGAGVGPSLAHVDGSVYLAGPYNGSPLSLVAITPAKVGPFDLGAVVVRLAVRIDPQSAEVSVDPSASDPIPRILHGLPVHLRQIRALVDRPGFILNPTSCERTATAATVLGAPTLASASSGAPVTVTVPFQAAGCGDLAFKPKLTLRLKGGPKEMQRSGHPQLTAILRPRGGDANIGATTVLLPHSQFIDQFHISNPCTRVQFAEAGGAGAGCPKGSVLGTVKAYTPLLDQPLTGKIYFRSNGGERTLPDVVLSLDGQFHIEQVGFVDSRHGRVRTRFAAIPDAPISRVLIKFFGGARGLLENSTNLCAHNQAAHVTLKGQNGKVQAGNTVIATSCGKGKPGKRRSSHR